MQPTTRRLLRLVALVALVVAASGFAWLLVGLARGGDSPFVVAAAAVSALLAGVGFWLLVAVGALRATRPAHDAPAPRPMPGPLAMPDAAALEDLPEPVTACPECGFVGIRMAGIQEGVWPGGGSMMKVVCPRCNYVGLPLEFARREDYAAFLAEMGAVPR